MKSLRLFVAIELPEPLKIRLERVRDELSRAAGRAIVSWTRREHYHLTLRFLGTVDDSRRDDLQAAIHEVCSSREPMVLRAQGVGFFPNGRLPRVIWAGIHSTTDLLFPLQQAIQAATGRFTAEAPEDRFRGHATLGRVKNIERQDAAALAELACTMADCVFGEWTSNEVELLRSELTPEGALHTVIQRFSLGSGRLPKRS